MDQKQTQLTIPNSDKNAQYNEQMTKIRENNNYSPSKIFSNESNNQAAFVQSNLNDIIVSRFRNTTNVAEGTSLPAPVRNGFRIPPVSSLQVLKTQAGAGGGTDFTLGWLEPEAIKNVEKFNIFASNAYHTNGQPIYLTSAPFSPVIVHISSNDTGRIVTFFVQPELHNGLRGEVNFTSPLANGLSCPSCTGVLL